MKKIIIILLAILPSTYPKPPSDSLFYKATRINLILDEDVRNIRKNYLFNEVPNSKDKRLKCNLRIDSLNWEILIGIENNIIKSIRSESQGNQLNIQNYLLLLVSNVENIT